MISCCWFKNRRREERDFPPSAERPKASGVGKRRPSCSKNTSSHLRGHKSKFSPHFYSYELTRIKLKIIIINIVPRSFAEQNFGGFFWQRRKRRKFFKASAPAKIFFCQRSSPCPLPSLEKPGREITISLLGRLFAESSTEADIFIYASDWRTKNLLLLCSVACFVPFWPLKSQFGIFSLLRATFHEPCSTSTIF